MPLPILYLGDTDLTDAAAYLAGLMTHWGWSYDYVPSHVAATSELLEGSRSLIIISDYPAANISPDLQQLLIDQVAQGTGLLMCGGWESFHGLGGDWDGSLVAEALPVAISDQDDRVNCDQPVLVAPTVDHPAIEGLPWTTRPPVIGGFNRVIPKHDALVVLNAVQFSASHSAGEWVFAERAVDPLLVVGEHGAGRTAALATDVAPHWVGPLVDWGLPRVEATAPGGNPIEVGGDYSRFLQNLLSWVRSDLQ